MMTRNKVFAALGANPTNPRWSWCALAPDHSRAVFTLWEDEMRDGRNVLFWPNYNTKLRHGESDQRRILELVLRDKIPSYGLICVARDINATPRSIREIRAEYLIKLRIEKEGDGIYGRHLGPVHLVDLIKESKERAAQADGLSDLGTPPEGDRYPDRAKVTGWAVIRDPKVREFVIRSAKGHCEYCGKKGFQLPSGAFYLEAHHIISLANQGHDTVENVIALCPEHHREAHYGTRAEELELEFIKKLTERKK